MTSRLTITPDRFTAATWNVFHDTPRATLEPTLERLVRLRTRLILMQEASKAAHRSMLLDAGFSIAFHPRQYVIAWDPAAFLGVASGGVRLSPTSYWSAGGDHHQWSEAATAILVDRVGRSLEAMSYHAPAHVQVKDAAANRLQASRESLQAMTARAKVNKARAVRSLFAGDDNIDERFGHWPWANRRPLRQVTAPSGTHGRRRIDDFRVAGLTPTSPGLVIPVPAPDDHHVHVREFTWSRRWST